MANTTSATPLLPAGGASVALRMAGNPAAANPLGFAIFGTFANGSRVFRANGPLAWTDLGPIDASAQFNGFAIVAAPRPDFMVATARTPLYQQVPFVWHLGDALRRLDSVIVNPIATLPSAPLQVVDSNASGTILVNAGPTPMAMDSSTRRTSPPCSMPGARCPPDSARRPTSTATRRSARRTWPRCSPRGAERRWALGTTWS